MYFRVDVRRNMWRVLVLVSVAILAAGCLPSNKAIIEAPLPNSVHGVAPNTYRIGFQNPLGLTESLLIRLNDVNVSSHFVVAGDRLSVVANGSNLASLILPGDNELTVVLPYRSAATFHYDTVGPELHVLDIVHNGTNLDISGYLEDRGEAASLLINGANATLLADNQFSVNTSILPTMQVTAMDVFGNTRVSHYASPAATINEAIQVEFNDSALAKFSTSVADLIGVVDLNSLGLGGAPLVYSYVNGLDRTDVYLTSLSMGTVTAALTVDQLNADGTLDVTSDLANVVFGVDVDVTTAGFNLGRYAGTITANNVAFTADVTPALAASALQVDTPVTNLSVDVSAGFSYDFPTAPAQLLTEFAVLVPEVGRSIGEQLIGQILPDTLSSVMTPLISFPLDLGNPQIDVVTQAQKFWVEGDSLNLKLDSGFRTLSAALGVTPALGSKYESAVMPTLLGSSPNASAYEVGMILSNNIINQLLLTAYETGQFSLNLDRTIDFSGLGIVGVFLNGELSATDNVRIILKPVSPPFITLGNQATAMGEIVMHDLQVELLIKRAAEIDFTPAFQATIHLQAPFNLEVASTGDIAIALGGAPSLSLLRWSAVTGSLVTGSELIESLMNLVMAEILPTTLSTLATIPVPAVNGFKVVVVDSWPLNQQQVAVAANLQPIP